MKRKEDFPEVFFGPGVSRDKEKTKEIVKYAKSIGFKGFDTSSAYDKCEDAIGSVLKNAPREDFFITTKISNFDQRNKTVEEALNDSMKKLNVDYLDLYLMHWPQTETFLETWKEMEELYEKGLVKMIGVSNFHIHHFNELFEVAEIKPMVHQFEIHPLFTQKDLTDFCRKENIQIMAYTPTGRCDDRLFNNQYLIDFSLRHKKSIVQIILKWHIQKGYIPVIKTENRIHLQENLDLQDFVLCQEEIEKIDSININSRLRYDSDNCDFMRL